MPKPLSPESFNRLMAPLGPFPAAPAFAVAVSGGADSMALAVLLQEWLAARGGRLVPLVVDHGLRPESLGEARATCRTLRRLGMTPQLLRWQGPKPTSGLQAAARAARYALLEEACRKAGLLYLFLAHHQDDQAETLLLRAAGGSGLEGLAAMAPVSPSPQLLRLRPLLKVRKARLRATLVARAIPWIEDPSNLDPRFARVRLRQAVTALTASGLSTAALAQMAGLLARSRAHLMTACNELLAQSLHLHPAGFVLLEREVLRRAVPLLRTRALALALRAVGGAAQAPALAAVERLWDQLERGRAGTLAGCRLWVRRDHLLLCREEAPLRPDPRLWDGRFRLPPAPRGQRWRPLGRAGWDKILIKSALPGPARWSLPTRWRGEKPLSVAFISPCTEPTGVLWQPWPPLGGLSPANAFPVA